MTMSEGESEPKKKRHPQWAGGPMGLGDPDDLRLRKTETQVIIPKWLKEEATNRCSETLQGFYDCAKKQGVLVTFNCKKENNLHNECLLRWLKDPDFIEEITNKYLAARSHFRRTGEPLEKYQRKKPKSFC